MGLDRHLEGVYPFNHPEQIVLYQQIKAQATASNTAHPGTAESSI